MRWRGGRESENVEDRRGMRGGGPVMISGGLGTLVIVLVLLFLGVDPQALLGPGGLEQAPQPGPQPQAGVPDEMSQFVSVVLASTEDVWNKQFAAAGRRYREPKLVLFTGQVESACGYANAAVGPFYCPADQKVYLDLSFFRELAQRFRAPGDFAQAYVIAHEVGHHVQNLLGISEHVARQRGRIPQADYNRLSVRLELQADFLAGVWAHHAQREFMIIEEGDIEEALRAASAIGDDRLQRQTQGYVVPDAFTHGTSQQRVRWFTRGFKSGRLEDGDTFAVPDDEL
jgi:predicted metalloprotease